MRDYSSDQDSQIEQERILQKLIKIDSDQYKSNFIRSFYYFSKHRKYLLQHVINIINQYPYFTGTIYLPSFNSQAAEIQLEYYHTVIGNLDQKQIQQQQARIKVQVDTIHKYLEQSMKKYQPQTNTDQIVQKINQTLDQLIKPFNNQIY